MGSIVTDTQCDDGNPVTINDRFDDQCNCIGYLTTQNDCQQDTLMLGDTLLTLDRYSAIRFLGSSSITADNGTVQLVADESIQLYPGFEGRTGAILTLEIDDCTQVVAVREGEPLALLQKQLAEDPLVLYDTDKENEKIIGFHVPQSGHVTLSLNGVGDDRRIVLLDHEVRNSGYYTKRINTKKLDSSTYRIIFRNSEGKYSEKLTIY